jgi:UDP-glucose 4-epimerase
VDVARANVLAADAKLPVNDGTIDAVGFNIGTSVQTSVVELAHAMMKSAGVEVPIEHAPARTGELLSSALLIGKASRVLGWKPEISLHDGLRATYEWIVKGAS